MFTLKSTIQEKKSKSQNNIFLEIAVNDLEKLGPYLAKLGFNLSKIRFLDWDVHGISIELPQDREKQWGFVVIKYDGTINVSIGFPLNNSSDKFHRTFKEFFRTESSI